MPYPQMTKDGPVANGIAFCCANTMKPQPSLINIYKGIYEDCYSDKDINMMSDFPDLSYLTGQNIMLTNASLNCPVGLPGRYYSKWMPFWELVFKNILSHKKDLVYIFMGKQAQYYMSLTGKDQHILKCEHPVAAEYAKRTWVHNNVFSKAKSIVKEKRGIDLEFMMELPF